MFKASLYVYVSFLLSAWQNYHCDLGIRYYIIILVICLVYYLSHLYTWLMFTTSKCTYLLLSLHLWTVQQVK